MSATKLIVVEGCALTGEVSAPDDTTVVVVPATSVPIGVLNAHGMSAYATIDFLATYTTYVGSGVLSGTSTKTLSGGVSIVLDDAQATATLTNTVSPYDTKTCTVTVKQAGQQKAKAI